MSVESLSGFIARLPAGPEAARPLYESADALSDAIGAGADWCQGYALGGVSQDPTRIGKYAETVSASHAI